MEACPQCGASLGAGYRFCGSCGASVGGCPSCGEPGVPGERFCHACGYAVNTAARVQSVAEPGQVLVDAATQRLARSAIGFTDAGRKRCQPLLSRAAAPDDVPAPR